MSNKIKLDNCYMQIDAISLIHEYENGGKLYIGKLPSDKFKQWNIKLFNITLEHYNIKYIFRITSMHTYSKDNIPGNIRLIDKYMEFAPLKHDNLTATIAMSENIVIDIIDKLKAGINVFLHCTHGRNRSFIIYYLLMRTIMIDDDAQYVLKYCLDIFWDKRCTSPLYPYLTYILNISKPYDPTDMDLDTPTESLASDIVNKISKYVPSLKNNAYNSNNTLWNLPTSILHTDNILTNKNALLYSLKYDGTRCMLLIEHSIAYVLYRDKKYVTQYNIDIPKEDVYIFDCEEVFNNKKNKTYISIFDLISSNGKSHIDTPFHTRLMELYDIYNKYKYSFTEHCIITKSFYKYNNIQKLKRQCDIYKYDGIIVYNKNGLYGKNQYKIKPRIHNTVDLYITANIIGDALCVKYHAYHIKYKEIYSECIILKTEPDKARILLSLDECVCEFRVIETMMNNDNKLTFKKLEFICIRNKPCNSIKVVENIFNQHNKLLNDVDEIIEKL